MVKNTITEKRGRGNNFNFSIPKNFIFNFYQRGDFNIYIYQMKGGLKR